MESHHGWLSSYHGHNAAEGMGGLEGIIESHSPSHDKMYNEGANDKENSELRGHILFASMKLLHGDYILTY